MKCLDIYIEAVKIHILNTITKDDTVLEVAGGRRRYSGQPSLHLMQKSHS